MSNHPPVLRATLAAALTLASTLFPGCGPEPLLPEENEPGESQAAALTELLRNGDFSTGSPSPWWGGSSAQSRVENGQWRLDVTTGTANAWDVVAGQSGLLLARGQSYTLAFNVSASTSGSLTATVQEEAAPYTTTLSQKLQVDGTSRRHTFTFTSSLSSARAQVAFQLGGEGARTLRLDNISLTTEGSSPLSMTNGFYVDPNSTPAAWVKANPNDERTASIQSSIASKPFARWFGDWNTDITASVSKYVAAASAANKLPILVAYNIPGRDCGSHSSGGAGSPEAYRTWFSAFVAGLGNRPAIVIIEPDAVAQLDCLPDDAARQTRLSLLIHATEQLRARAPNTWAYLDAGNAMWIAADTMAQRLHSAGVSNIRGFVLNVSNYYTTAESLTHGNAVSAALSSRYGYGKPFVVDTSRNGNGSNRQWCNPTGRKLGTTSQVGGGADMLLWVKVPGNSDGNCGSAPNSPAGQFEPHLAMSLIQGI